MELKTDYKYLAKINSEENYFSGTPLIVEFMVLKISNTSYKIKLLNGSEDMFWLEKDNTGVTILEELGPFLRKSHYNNV